MEKVLGLTEARRQFSDIVNEVFYHGDAYIIEKQGKPAAAVVPLGVYEQWQTRRARLFQLIEEVQALNPGVDPDEVMADIVAAQHAGRQQYREE